MRHLNVPILFQLNCRPNALYTFISDEDKRKSLLALRITLRSESPFPTLVEDYFRGINIEAQKVKGHRQMRICLL